MENLEVVDFLEPGEEPAEDPFDDLVESVALDEEETEADQGLEVVLREAERDPGQVEQWVRLGHLFLPCVPEELKVEAYRGEHFEEAGLLVEGPHHPLDVVLRELGQGLQEEQTVAQGQVPEAGQAEEEVRSQAHLGNLVDLRSCFPDFE